MVTENVIKDTLNVTYEYWLSFLFFDSTTECLSTHFFRMFPFYTPWKHQKSIGFLMCLRCIKSEHRQEMG